MSIECIQLGKTFKNRTLFQNMDIVFQKGTCHCITGENGSGKTTFLKIIAGLEKADFGTIQVKGTCTYSGSNPYMLRGTVMENIMYPLGLKRNRLKKDKNHVLNMIEQLGLQGLENREAHSLSSGEKQKVALGRALILDPDVLLLDEPTANIDNETIERIERILLSYVNDKNHTLILVSHDMDQARRLSGDIWVLKGRELSRLRKSCDK